MDGESDQASQQGDMPDMETRCPYCALQCPMGLVAGGVEMAVTAGPGGLCQKGWSAAELLRHGDRLTAPLIRVNDELVPASWPAALDRIAEAIGTIQHERGRDAVGVFGGGGLTNEKVYNLGKFARTVLCTPMIDYNGRFCMSSAAAASNRAFGIDRGLPFPVTDLAEADVILLIGGNVAETMPPLMRHLISTQLIVVDPRRTATADKAALHLQPLPGTDIALLNGLLNLILRDDKTDHDYIAAHTEGFAEVRAAVAQYWPARVEQLTGISIAELEKAAGLLGSAGSAVVLTARGAEQHVQGTETATAAINLALALGLPGRPASGYGTLTGQGNGQGGREHGQKADQLPGYRRIDDPSARAHIARVWRVEPEQLPGPGVSACELLNELGGALAALFVFGSNPVVSAPNAGHVTQRLGALDFLVVADVVLSETAQLADVVLPAAQWAEEDGTTTNLAGQVGRRRKLLDAPGEVRTDLEIIAALAHRLAPDRGAEFATDARTVFAELGEASAGGAADYAGISFDRIDQNGPVSWPCPAPAHPGTPRLFTDGRFFTPTGKARFTPVYQRQLAEGIDDDYPVYLTTGRIVSQYQSGAQTRRIASLGGNPFVQIHPQLAERIGIESGVRIKVTSRRGTVIVPARITDRIRPDTVFIPFHWPDEARVNSVVSDALDPTSGMPEFKVCAVKVDRV